MLEVGAAVGCVLGLGTVGMGVGAGWGAQDAVIRINATNIVGNRNFLIFDSFQAFSSLSQ